MRIRSRIDALAARLEGRRGAGPPYRPPCLSVATDAEGAVRPEDRRRIEEAVERAGRPPEGGVRAIVALLPPGALEGAER